MGVIQFAEADLDAEMANDEAAAEELDAEMSKQMAHVERRRRRESEGVTARRASPFPSIRPEAAAPSSLRAARRRVFATIDSIV